jgi:hypothetical protein
MGDSHKITAGGIVICVFIFLGFASAAGQLGHFGSGHFFLFLSGALFAVAAFLWLRERQSTRHEELAAKPIEATRQTAVKPSQRSLNDAPTQALPSLDVPQPKPVPPDTEPKADVFEKENDRLSKENLRLKIKNERLVDKLERDEYSTTPIHRDPVDRPTANEPPKVEDPSQVIQKHKPPESIESLRGRLEQKQPARYTPQESADRRMRMGDRVLSANQRDELTAFLSAFEGPLHLYVIKDKEAAWFADELFAVFTAAGWKRIEYLKDQWSSAEYGLILTTSGKHTAPPYAIELYNALNSALKGLDVSRRFDPTQSADEPPVLFVGYGPRRKAEADQAEYQADRIRRAQGGPPSRR